LRFTVTVNVFHLSLTGSAQILTGTQNETGLEQIQYLEDRSRYQRSEFVEETTKQAPIFTTSLKHINIKEGQRAHFECRLIPVSDPTMKVEWFHNNVPVKSGESAENTATIKDEKLYLQCSFSTHRFSFIKKIKVILHLTLLTVLIFVVKLLYSH
jgi:hypothetical protein